MFFNCEHKTNIEYFNESELFHYKSRNGLNKPVLKEIITYFSKDYNVELIKKGDTIQVHGTHNTEKDDYGYFGAWISKKDYLCSEIKCEKKVIFHQNEFQYSFCYEDLVDYLDKQIAKSEKEIKYIGYIKRKENFLKYKHGIDSSFTKNDDVYMISDLIMNIPFSIYDKFEKKEIIKVSSTNFQTGLLDSIGYDHFFFDKNNDTIASMSIVYIMH
ncbi:hypothetical protein [Lacinutrix algicola]|uniref:hypothetical protein n=1 Tax=Lacinutrix algicola TaxID=342954 RepID=UPI00128EE659|nr:hypothetical protein [Lacinutrix algicola]